jgi:2-dehydropantoate 2-reductase
MNLLIWGAGAIGGTVGAFLAREGHQITLVDKVKEHVDAINYRGLSITGPVDEFTVRAPSFTTDRLTGRYETILLCVKGHDTENAVRELLPFLSDHGYVVSVQNGLSEITISQILGEKCTVGSFINFGADYMEPGVIHFGGRGSVVLGEMHGQITERIHDLHDTFQDFDKNAIITSNIWGYLWGKLAYASMLFATALTNESMADALDSSIYRPVYIALAQEVLTVATAKRITPEPFDGFDPLAFMPDTDISKAMHSLDELVSFNRLSTKTHSGIWRDLSVRKRRTEVDSQLVPVVSFGGQLDIPTPLNTRLIELIHEIEDGKRAQSINNLDLLKEMIQ